MLYHAAYYFVILATLLSLCFLCLCVPLTLVSIFFFVLRPEKNAAKSLALKIVLTLVWYAIFHFTSKVFT